MSLRRGREFCEALRLFMNAQWKALHAACVDAGVERPDKEDAFGEIARQFASNQSPPIIEDEEMVDLLEALGFASAVEEIRAEAFAVYLRENCAALPGEWLMRGARAQAGVPAP